MNYAKNYIRDYLEYENIEDDQFIISIEFCSNCDNHTLHTHHSAQLYENFATHLKQTILIRFPFIKVILKPIDNEIKPDQFFGTDITKINTINSDIKQVRIGAMEVQLCYKLQKSNKKVFFIHSKLQTGHWPSIQNVLNDVAKNMPTFNLNLRAFDAENVKDRYQDLKDDELKKILGSKIENVKVNLYKIKSKKIQDFSDSAKNEVENTINPKKRIEMMSKTKKEIKESYSSLPIIHNNYNSFHLNRPSTHKSHMKSVKSSSQNFTIFTKENTLIRDKEKIDLLKGDILVSLYTSDNGKLKFKNTPYDSYLIEVEESPNYHGCAMIFSLDQIKSDKKVKRYIPLYTQTQSYVKLFVYSENKDKNEDEKVIDAEVLVNNIGNLSMEKEMLYDDSGFKIKLKENPKILGRYEGIIVPGKYSVTISKKGFSLFTKDMDFIPEENIINIKIEKEIEYFFKVKIISYDKFQPVENANIKLSCGINDLVVEGVTNAKGKYKFNISSREDFTTIYVSRIGYFPCQRTYVRNSIEECAKGIKMIVLLIPEAIVQKEHSVIMVTYCNNYEENFVPSYLFSNTSITFKI